jgi:hypothetical protein
LDIFLKQTDLKHLISGTSLEEVMTDGCPKCTFGEEEALADVSENEQSDSESEEDQKEAQMKPSIRRNKMRRNKMMRKNTR